MTESSPQDHEPEQRRGVIFEKIENNHHVIEVIWADGAHAKISFPTRDMELFDHETKEHLGKITDVEAVELLKKYSGTITQKEFSWRNLFQKSK